MSKVNLKSSCSELSTLKEKILDNQQSLFKKLDLSQPSCPHQAMKAGVVQQTFSSSYTLRGAAPVFFCLRTILNNFKQLFYYHFKPLRIVYEADWKENE